MEYIGLALLGILIGLASSLIGVGGGVLLVPLLPILANINQKEVIATSLFTVFFVVLFNTIGFHRKRLVNWPVVLTVTPAAALFAYMSGKFSTSLDDETLKIILVIMLVTLALRVLTRRAPVEDANASSDGYKVHGLKLLIMGILAGLCTGFTGVGAGILISPILLMLAVVKPHEVSPVSNAIMTFSTLFGALGYVGSLNLSSDHWRLGFVLMDYSLVLVPVAIVVATFGRKWQVALSFQQRKWALGGILILFGLKEMYMLVSH